MLWIEAYALLGATSKFAQRGFDNQVSEGKL